MTADLLRVPAGLILAISYAKRGWYVFPCYEILPDGTCACGADCGSPGKHPRTARGFKQATVEREQIRAWWAQWPDANVGVATEPSGLVVVDVDPRNQGDEGLATLERKHDKLPATVTSLTGGGGQHYVFQRPPGTLRLPSRALPYPYVGVDLKADGAYIIAPPSTHYSGGAYQWDTGSHPDDTPLAQLPAWLLSLIVATPYGKQSSGLPPVAGVLGAAFTAAAMQGRLLGPSKMAVECPWEASHTTGKRYDSSTIVYGPNPGRNLGWFHCSHSHCAGRKPQEVLDALPPDAVAAAKEQLGMDRDAPIAPVVMADTAAPADWKTALKYSGQGTLTRDQGNLLLMLRNEPGWSETLAYDSFREVFHWRSEPPPIPGLMRPKSGAVFSDADYLYVQHWFAVRKNVTFGIESTRAAVDSCAYRYDSLTDYMNCLQWDGEFRVDRWLHTYLGAVDCEANRFIGRAWLVSAVARALTPGCQADHVMVLEGPQGCGKTTALRILGGDWYLGSIPDVREKDARLILGRAWIVEIKELAGIRAAGEALVKAYLDETIDIYRSPYARNVTNKPRRCVFSGTTNELNYLADRTGNRRYWPVRVARIKRDELARDRDQLIAEAKVAFLGGESWHPTSDARRDALTAEQAERLMDDDPWLEPLAAWVARNEGARLTASQVLATVLDLPRQYQGHSDARRVGKILRGLGCRYSRDRSGALWVVPTAPEREPGEDG